MAIRIAVTMVYLATYIIVAIKADVVSQWQRPDLEIGRSKEITEPIALPI